MSLDLTDSKKIVFLIPTEHATKLSTLLKKLEQMPEIIIAIEMTSLEDAYLRIVKKDQQIKDIYQIEHDQSDMMEMYCSTKGKESDLSQLMAMYSRRLKVFTREPR